MILLKALSQRIPNDYSEQLLTIQQASFIPAWSASQIQQQLLHKNAQNFVLYEEDKIIGFIFYRSMFEQSEILQVAITPLRQHQGLGKRIIEESLAVIKNTNQSIIEKILLEVRASNIPAINLYQGLGFSLDGIRKNYYAPLTASGEKENAHLYSLNLSI